MIAIISDIHGNYPALKKVLESIDETGCEKVICLGDTAGYYCMINECIEELRNRKIVSLLGNHDQYLLNGTGCPRSNSANYCLEFQEKVIKADNKIWLSNCETSLSIDDMNFVHGGWNDPIEEYLYDIRKEYFERLKGRVFISGHTHVQKMVDFGEKIYCNPGSVGQPRDGDPRASYAIISNNKITLKRVEYDIDSVASEMKRNGFEPYYYENLYRGLRIGGKRSFVTINN